MKLVLVGQLLDYNLTQKWKHTCLKVWSYVIKFLKKMLSTFTYTKYKMLISQDSVIFPLKHLDLANV